MANNIKSIREHSGLTIEQLADIVGKSKGYVSQLENGKKRLNEDTIDDFSKALNCPRSLIISDNPDDLKVLPILSRLAEADPDARAKILEYADFVLRQEASR